jgi:adenylate cyclase
MSATAADDSVVANPLRASGLVDHSALEQAREYQREHGGLLSDALLQLDLVREGDFLRVFAELYSTRFVKAEKLRTLKLDERLLERVGVRSSERLRLCPIRWDESTHELHVVAAVPLSSTLEPELRQSVGARSVTVYVATAGAVSALIRRSFYREEDAFAQVTANGAGPVAGARPTETLDEEVPPETTATRVTPDEVEPRDVEGKTVMVNLNTLSDSATIATLRKENARYRIAQEFHRRVTLERTLDAMVDRILEVMFELLPAEGAAIWLSSGQFRSRSRDNQKQVNVPRTIIDQVLTSANGVLANNALIDERFGGSESVMIRGIQSVMGVPLRTRNGTFGVLYVESISQSAAFQDDDLPLLDSVGAQAAMLLDNAALFARVQQEVENRVSLSRFLSAAAVEEVLSGRMNLKMEGQLADVTVLFADIRGFTTLSSQLPAEEVVRFLNQFFTEMVEAVDRHHGVVDKFIGDCVMAMWGAPVARESDARDALACAQEMVTRGSRISVQGAPLEMGVGVHSGPAVVGAIGGRQRLDYTAIGATVNLSARLCGIARAQEVLMTSDTLLRAGPGVVTEAGEAVILKGLEVPIVPYSLRSLAQPLPLVAPIKLHQLATQPGVPGPRRR